MTAARPTGYSVWNYGGMLRCEPRASAYAEALKQAVTPGCTVIEIGSGPGVFAALACRYGAGSVIAIEPDPSVELLPEIAERNQFADRITLVRGLSTHYYPERLADVIISDLRGSMPLFESHIPTIIDARQRLLAPDGILIPQRDRLRIAVIDHAKTFLTYAEPWLHNSFGLDLSPGHRFVTATPIKVTLDAADLLGDAEDLAVLDYGSVLDPDLGEEVTLRITSEGTAHGLAIWFDAELAPGIGFSNAPGEPVQNYGQTFFPLPKPIAVGSGDTMRVRIDAKLIGEAYVWRWSGTLQRAGSSNKPDARFSQTSFQSTILSSRALRSHANDFVPPAHRRHGIDRHCLDLIDGHRTLGEIAAQMYRDFADQFASEQEVLDYVVELTEHYGDEP